MTEVTSGQWCVRMGTTTPPGDSLHVLYSVTLDTSASKLHTTFSRENENVIVQACFFFFLSLEKSFEDLVFSEPLRMVELRPVILMI